MFKAGLIGFGIFFFLGGFVCLMDTSRPMIGPTLMIVGAAFFLAGSYSQWKQ
jgi:hypothetical protein